MRFDQPATTNPIDQGKVVGKPTPRIDGPLKTTGTAPYAYEHHGATADPAIGFVVGAAIAKGRIKSMDLAAARKAPGVLAIVTAQNAGKLGKGSKNTAKLLAGPEVSHYHQAVAVVVATTFENARAAAALIDIKYETAPGRFHLAAEKPHAPMAKGDGMGGKAQTKVGDFDAAFAKAPVTLDASYTTPDQGHAMMEPHATLAAWEGRKLT
ncbi:MAG: xanthine dehydrogenase family protein molybdopterin-binding subunit, partial [Rubrivivax sp.]